MKYLLVILLLGVGVCFTSTSLEELQNFDASKYDCAHQQELMQMEQAMHDWQQIIQHKKFIDKDLQTLNNLSKMLKKPKKHMHKDVIEQIQKLKVPKLTKIGLSQVKELREECENLKHHESRDQSCETLLKLVVYLISQLRNVQNQCVQHPITVIKIKGHIKDLEIIRGGCGGESTIHFDDGPEPTKPVQPKPEPEPVSPQPKDDSEQPADDQTPDPDVDDDQEKGQSDPSEPKETDDKDDEDVSKSSESVHVDDDSEEGEVEHSKSESEEVKPDPDSRQEEQAEDEEQPETQQEDEEQAGAEEEEEQKKADEEDKPQSGKAEEESEETSQPQQEGGSTQAEDGEEEESGEATEDNVIGGENAEEETQQTGQSGPSESEEQEQGQSEEESHEESQEESEEGPFVGPDHIREEQGSEETSAEEVGEEEDSVQPKSQSESVFVGGEDDDPEETVGKPHVSEEGEETTPNDAILGDDEEEQQFPKEEQGETTEEEEGDQAGSEHEKESRSSESEHVRESRSSESEHVRESKSSESEDQPEEGEEKPADASPADPVISPEPVTVGCKEVPDGIVDVAYSSTAAVFNHDLEISPENTYGFSFYFRWLSRFPDPLYNGLPTAERYHIASLGDSNLALYLGQGGYHFSTVDAEGEKFANAGHIEIEAKWTFVSVSYSNGQVVGYIQVEGEEAHTVHYSSESTEAESLTFNLGGPKGDIPSINGQFARVLVFSDQFVGTQDEFDALQACYPVPSKSHSQDQRLTIKVESGREFVATQKFDDESVFESKDTIFADEYSVSGWFKWTEINDQNLWHAGFRLTINDQANNENFKKLGDRDLAFFIGDKEKLKSKAGVCTYTYKGAGNPADCKLVEYGDDLTKWFYVYFGYNKRSSTAYAYVQFKGATVKQEFTNVYHFYSAKQYLYLGQDKFYPPFSGKIQNFYINFFTGSFSVDQYDETFGYLPKPVDTGADPIVVPAKPIRGRPIKPPKKPVVRPPPGRTTQYCGEIITITADNAKDVLCALSNYLSSVVQGADPNNDLKASNFCFCLVYEPENASPDLLMLAQIINGSGVPQVSQQSRIQKLIKQSIQ